jgi:protein TonB
MFEDSLMESQNRLSSPNQRWTTIVSLTLQCSVVAAVIALPLLHPDVLTFHTDAPTITLPLKPPMPRVPHLEPTHSANTPSTPAALPASGTPLPNLRNLGPINSNAEDIPPSTNIGSMTGPSDLPGSIGTSPAGAGNRVTLAPASATGPLHISRGVLAGLLLAPIRPVYPPIAISTRTEGVVVIQAIISKSGRIESAHASSGPELLRNAALEAIRNARYSPYLLNGQPTEVETTITVNFKLAG